MGYYIVDFRNSSLVVVGISGKKIEWGSMLDATPATTYSQANQIASRVQELGYRVRVVPSGG